MNLLLHQHQLLNPDLQPGRCSQSEWEVRCQLAYCYHLVEFMGWADSFFSHISARLPGSAQTYFVNPFGLNFTEVTPDNLLKVDLTGQKIEDSVFEGNPAGFALHGALHEARSDIQCIIHSQSTAISAVAQKKRGFDHSNFYGAQLYGRVGYHAFEGMTLYDDERPRLVASLADKAVLVLRNHGVAVAEASVASAFYLLYTVQRAAEIQCAAGALGGEDTLLPESVQQKCVGQAAMLARDNAFADAFFIAQIRKMQATRGPAW